MYCAQDAGMCNPCAVSIPLTVMIHCNAEEQCAPDSTALGLCVLSMILPIKVIESI